MKARVAAWLLLLCCGYMEDSCFGPESVSSDRNLDKLSPFCGASGRLKSWWNRGGGERGIIYDDVIEQNYFWLGTSCRHIRTLMSKASWK